MAKHTVYIYIGVVSSLASAVVEAVLISETQQKKPAITASDISKTNWDLV